MNGDYLDLDSILEKQESTIAPEYDLTDEQIANRILELSKAIQKDAKLVEKQSIESLEAVMNRIL